MVSVLTPVSRWQRVKAVGPVLGLVGWTLFTWANRIRLAAADTSLHGFSRLWAIGLAIVFTTVALALGAAALAFVAGSAGVPGGRLRRGALALALIGSAWWAVRGVQISLHDHPIGFKVVHSVLALVTIGLSALVGRWWQRLEATVGA